MAYKFQLGRHKLQAGASLDTTVGDIELGNNQVDSLDVRSLDAIKLAGAAKSTKAIVHTGLPTDTQTIKLSLNSVNYVVTVAAGVGADDPDIIDGSATIRLGNHANARSFYGKVKDLFNDLAIHDISAVYVNGADVDNGTLTLSSERPGEGFLAWGADSNNALPGAGVGSSSTAAGADKFLKFTNAGILERSAAQMTSDLGVIGASGGTMVGPMILDDTSIQIQEGSDTLTLTVPTLTDDRAVTLPDEAGAIHIRGGDLPATAFTGAITTNSTFDGRDVATDGSKLDGIEALADVTDATNVTAAGALMDSELSGISHVKALNQSVISGASPTFSTANLTDAAGKRLMTDAQESKLDAIEALADVTDATNVTAAGALMDSECTDLPGLKAASWSAMPAITMDANIAMGSNKVTGLANPTGNGDAATKGYVDAVAQGLKVKPAVSLASVANIAGTYVAAAGTITAGSTGAFGALDGVTPSQDDRILLKDQTAAAQNGIYTLSNAGGVGAAFVLTRATDMNTDNEFAQSFVFVSGGTAGADSSFVCTVDPDDFDAASLTGTVDVTFAQFAAAGQITAGTGLTKSSNTLAINATHTAITQIRHDDLTLGRGDGQDGMDFPNTGPRFKAGNVDRFHVTDSGPQILSGAMRSLVQTVSANAATSTLASSAGEVVIYKMGSNGINQAHTVTLPAVAGCTGMAFKVKRWDADPNAFDLTFDSNGSEKIDNSTSNLVLDGDSPDAAITLMCDGTQWFIL